MLITESWGLSRRASSPMATETVSDIVWSPSFLAVLRIRKKSPRRWSARFFIFFPSNAGNGTEFEMAGEPGLRTLTL